MSHALPFMARAAKFRAPTWTRLCRDAQSNDDSPEHKNSRGRSACQETAHALFAGNPAGMQLSSNVQCSRTNDGVN